MNILVTGGAGFIGSHLIKHLLDDGYAVTCVDNLILGSKNNIKHFFSNDKFKFFEIDVSDIELLDKIFKKNSIDIVYHLAANSDIQKSAQDPVIDFKNTFATTYAVLECMRRNKIFKLFFASTSAVYGEKCGVNLSEDIGKLFPISYYGGAKLASEAFISSYAHMNDLHVVIFRFPNVIGPNLTHGVILDFIRKLINDHSVLEILGDGTQTKPYIYVQDLIEAILIVTQHMEKGVEIFNVGAEGLTSVKEIADMVCETMKLSDVSYQFTGGDRGWKGDVPTFQYDLTKIHAKGWYAKYTSNEAVIATLQSFNLGRS